MKKIMVMAAVLLVTVLLAGAALADMRGGNMGGQQGQRGSTMGSGWQGSRTGSGQYGSMAGSGQQGSRMGSGQWGSMRGTQGQYRSMR